MQFLEKASASDIFNSKRKRHSDAGENGMYPFIGKLSVWLTDSCLSFPCPACGSLEVVERNLFCAECLAKLKTMHGMLCPGCGAELDTALELCSNCLKEEPRVWDKALALFQHEGLGRRMLHAFKYHNTPELARAFGQLAAEKLNASGLRPDYIIPVPLHWTRAWNRGFNQSELVAEELARRCDIAMSYDLRRVRRTRQQAKLTRVERKKNLIEAFSVNHEKFYKNASILLIDDVMTTGSTLQAAAEALRKCQAGKIIIMVIARRI